MSDYNKSAHRQGVHARFSHLSPSEALRDAACPYPYPGPLRENWLEGWAEGEKTVAPLEEHRKGLLVMVSSGLEDHVPVTLISYGHNKIPTIKALRLLLGLGLREAKDLAERSPVLVGVYPMSQAENVASTLRQAGATVDFPSALERLAAVGEEV